MLYWDSSALVASLILEQETNKVRSFAVKVGHLRSYTAMITPLEIESAIQRKIGEQSLSLKQADKVRLVAADFRKETYLVVLDQNILDVSLHLQKIYKLRVGDAVQLASARAGTEDPSRIHFFCLDRQLNEAAKREGFDCPFS